MHPKMKHIYVGVDTHKNTHTASIINCWNEKLGEITFDNNTSSFGKLLKEVDKHLFDGITPVFGLEDTNSVGRSLAVFLLKKNYIVKKVNSNLSYNERKKLPILHKTDSYDSLCVAKVLLDNLNTLPNADPMDIYWNLAMLVRRRESIIKASTALKNQLHAQISHHYPSYKKFFTVFDCPTALAFWETYPSPLKLKGATVDELGELLFKKSHNFYSVDKACQIFDIVQKDGNTITEYQEERDFMIAVCVRQLRQYSDEVKKIEEQLKNMMAKLGYKLETMIGIDLVAASSFIAEIGDIRRFATPDKLAKYSGIAPVTYSSGEKDKTFKSKQGNRKLYNLFRSLAARSISRSRNKKKPMNDIFYIYYQEKIKKGKTEQQALICVMRRLCNIIYGMMKNKSEYVHPTLSKAKTG